MSPRQASKVRQVTKPAGQTVVQKIIARAASRERVNVGEYVEVTPDHSVCMELVWPLHLKNMERIGVDNVARPDKVVMVIDHTTSGAMGSDYWKNHKSMRDFTTRNGIKNFFGPGTGLRHHVLTEKGFARPGVLIFGDEQNIASIGAVGALCIPIGPEIFVPLVTDRNWVSVPRTARFELTGKLPFGVTARDLVQKFLRDFGANDKLLQTCVEFGGEGLSELSLDDRQTLCATVYHAGADTAICDVDQRALDYVAARAQGRPLYRFAPDADAEYYFKITYNLSELEPTVTPPPELSASVPLREVQGRRVDQATIGSCAGNRLDDLRAAAEVLKGRTIAPHVTMYITPGSREIYADAAAEGLIEIFARAGANVLAPGCTTCWGYQGLLSDAEVSISTHQFNYRGRNGSREASIYLAGAYVVAAAAVAGEIVDPRTMLKEGGRS
jgi:3-isopropylmalate/(R)-2-methylmalate dehydratase large subunit